MNASLDRLAAALADRYRIERELGAGGMATVYLAEDLKHRRRVAVKVLKPELAAVLGAERFVQEITTTAALQHPHILPLFDSGEADGFLFYVMPFIDGETLRAGWTARSSCRGGGGEDCDVDCRRPRLRAPARRDPPRHQAGEHPAARGPPHGRRLRHRPGRLAAAGGRMTETGLSLGTPHYMSPEQATAEREISARSDIYSLASVLYEMLAGNPPHVGASAQQIIMKIITEPAGAGDAVPPVGAADTSRQRWRRRWRSCRPTGLRVPGSLVRHWGTHTS
jgi:eukaryotic-like serine/threonine-protein kinase